MFQDFFECLIERNSYQLQNTFKNFDYLIACINHHNKHCLWMNIIEVTRISKFQLVDVIHAKFINATNHSIFYLFMNQMMCIEKRTKYIPSN
jgi:hypothetical protein